MQKIDSVGRISIPVDIRKNLGLKNGEEITIEEKNGGVFISPRENRTIINDKDIESLQRIFLKIQNIDTINNSDMEYFKGLCRFTENKCFMCGSNMFSTGYGTYKCINCNEE